MPRAKNTELTRCWQPKKGLTPKWRKIYKGQKFYFRGTYDQALAQWEQKKVELDKQNDENLLLEPYEKFRALMNRWRCPHIAHSLDEMVAEQPHLLEWIVKTYINDILAGLVAIQFAEANPQFQPFIVVDEDEDYFRTFAPIVVDENTDASKYFLNQETAIAWCGQVREEIKQHYNDNYRAAPQATTIAQALEQFLDRQRAKVNGGLQSSGRYSILQRCLEHFKSFLGGRVGVDRLDAIALEQYHSQLLEQMRNGWTAEYAVLYMQAAKQFVRWAWRKHFIGDLPRNMDDSDLAIATTPKKLKTFLKEEIHRLFSYATERTKLYLLLMLNAGMTQKDIADLTKDEVDLAHGWIERKRSKTKKHDNVPTIRYKLWQTTLELLKKQPQHDSVLLLVNADGKPLKVDELRNGKGVSIDNIATAYKRLIATANSKAEEENVPKISKSLKHFRKTSAGKLEDSQFSQCSRWFLGHAPRSVADINYLPPPQKTFDRAIKWLAKEYGIE